MSPWFSGQSYQGPGSSGLWAQSPTYGPQGGAIPGYGRPGDLNRIYGGFEPLDPSLRYRSPSMPSNNPVNLNFHFGNPGGPAGQQPTTVSSTKNPIIQNAINGSLGSLPGGVSGSSGASGQGQNPFVLQQNTHNPALAAAMNGMLQNSSGFSNPRDFTRSGQYQQGINQGFAQAGADQAQNRNQFGDFANMFSAQNAGTAANVGQENSAVSNWYNGGVANQLENNANQWQTASRALMNQALGRVQKNNSLVRMSQGDGSYATQQALDTSGRIAAQQAQAEAELRRNNLMTVLQGQGQYGGVRNRNLDYLSNRQLVPIQALQQLGSYENSRLAGLGGMDLSNNLYTTPAEQAQQRAGMLGQLTSLDNANNTYTLDNPYNRRLNNLGQLQQLDSGNNFYGLTKQYQPDNSGYFYQPRFNTNPQVNNSNFNTPPVYNPYASFGSAPSSISPTPRGYGTGPGGTFQMFDPQQSPYFG